MLRSLLEVVVAMDESYHSITKLSDPLLVLGGASGACVFLCCVQVPKVGEIVM